MLSVTVLKFGMQAVSGWTPSNAKIKYNFQFPELRVQVGEDGGGYKKLLTVLYENISLSMLRNFKKSEEFCNPALCYV